MRPKPLSHSKVLYGSARRRPKDCVPLGLRSEAVWHRDFYGRPTRSDGRAVSLLQSSIIAITDHSAGYSYPPEVRFEVPEQDISAYRRAADFINLANVDVLCLQHEFGIYGGLNGRHILTLLRNVRLPVVSTLHTILHEPTREQKLVFKEVIKLSTRVVAMAEKGIEFLREVYETPLEKIDLIPHGIPDVPFIDPNYYKDKFGVEGRPVLLTFGLLSPNKGIEQVLNALRQLSESFPTSFIWFWVRLTRISLPLKARRSLPQSQLQPRRTVLKRT